METPLYFKCEPECSSDLEESPDTESNLQLPSDNSVEVEVEPDHTFYHSNMEEENSELDKKNENEEGDHEDCDTNATLLKNFVDNEATTCEILQGQECNDTGKEEGTLHSHLIQQMLPWICLICKRTFKTESSLKVHTYVSCRSSQSFSLHYIANKTSSFDKSAKTSDNIPSVQAPDNVPLVQAANATCDEKGCVCQTCGKKFSGSSSLSRHNLIHTGGRPHPCTLCDKRFALKSNLRAHMMTHTSYKPHSCTICEKAFLTKPNLRRHMLTHTGQKFHSCDTCGKSFALSNNLKTHLLTHTGGKPFSCELCGKDFSHRSNLKTHMFTHSHVRPHTCPTCGKSFTLKCHLNTHMLIHTNPNRYSCNTCEKHFSKKVQLVKHVATHLNGDGH